MTVAQTIFSGVAVILIAGLIMGAADVYVKVQEVDELKETMPKVLDSLARIEERQKMFEEVLLKD